MREESEAAREELRKHVVERKLNLVYVCECVRIKSIIHKGRKRKRNLRK